MSERAPTFSTIPRGIFTLLLPLENIEAITSSLGNTEEINIYFKDFIFIFKTYVYGVPLCGHVYTGTSAFRGQKSLLDLLELELHAAVSLPRLGNKSKSSARAVCTLSL